ncbi:MAG: RNA polymerase sigma factor [Candidatus Tritonobacter lacicola]|nr:RNA polymerase sigma factor [Candidatus Tritonobacter lacicola]
MPDSDETLMSLVRRNDREAFARLFNRYKTRIMTFIYNYVGNYERAEDLFQETFIRLWRSRRRYDGERPLRPWLYTIAANLCRDNARKMRYRRTVSIDAAREGWAPSEKLPSPLPSPAKIAEEKESSLSLRAALDSLPKESRIAITLHQFHGLKYREIAETLGVPIGTVKSRIHSAVKQLRKILSIN